MILAAVHLDPRIVVPAAAALVVVLAWYWRRLGRADVPRPRRTVRRASLVLMLSAVPAFAAGLSLFDPEVRGIAYMVSWSVGTLLVVGVFLVACIDALVTLRLTEAEHLDVVRDALGKAERGDDEPTEGGA